MPNNEHFVQDSTYHPQFMPIPHGDVRYFQAVDKSQAPFNGVNFCDKFSQSYEN